MRKKQEKETKNIEFLAQQKVTIYKQNMVFLGRFESFCLLIIDKT